MLPVVSQSSKWASWFCRAAAGVSSGGSLVPAQTLSRARIHACWRSTRIAYWFWPSPDFYSSTSMRFTFFDWMVYNFYRPDLIQEYFGSSIPVGNRVCVIPNAFKLSVTCCWQVMLDVLRWRGKFFFFFFSVPQSSYFRGRFPILILDRCTPNLSIWNI